MAVRIREEDKFILERPGDKNYHVTGEDIRDYVPPFEAGTKCVFFQSRAPLEWTTISEANNVTIKIVHTDSNASAGGRTINSTSFTNVFKSNVAVPMPSHTHGFSQSNHNHKITGKSHNHGANFNKNHSHSGGSGGSHVHTTILQEMNKNFWDKTKWTGGSGSGETISTQTGGSAGGGYSNNKSGVSVKNKSVTGTPSSKKLGIGTSNPVDVTGSNSPTINMQLKYRDCIICSKDAY